MIINTGNRTDIPAFYARWLCNRVRAGEVMARSPYNESVVYRYALDPQVVDLLCFCTKNPAPLLAHLGELSAFRQFWCVTLTPYGRDLEPAVPDKRRVVQTLHRLSEAVGPAAVCVRYDPIIITPRYGVDFHLRAFERLLSAVGSCVSAVIFSFIDLYARTRRRLPEVREVTPAEQAVLCQGMAEACARRRLPLRGCLEHPALARFGADMSGCMSVRVLSAAIGRPLCPPRSARGARRGCECLLGCDIGAYSSCPHDCRYCYANHGPEAVRRRVQLHDPHSPLLLGQLQAGDRVQAVEQRSWLTPPTPP